MRPSRPVRRAGGRKKRFAQKSRGVDGPLNDHVFFFFHVFVHFFVDHVPEVATQLGQNCCQRSPSQRNSDLESTCISLSRAPAARAKTGTTCCDVHQLDRRAKNTHEMSHAHRHVWTNDGCGPPFGLGEKAMACLKGVGRSLSQSFFGMLLFLACGGVIWFQETTKTHSS